jgi:hypothetical protein
VAFFYFTDALLGKQFKIAPKSYTKTNFLRAIFLFIDSIFILERNDFFYPTLPILRLLEDPLALLLKELMQDHQKILFEEILNLI